MIRYVEMYGKEKNQYNLNGIIEKYKAISPENLRSLAHNMDQCGCSYLEIDAEENCFNISFFRLETPEESAKREQMEKRREAEQKEYIIEQVKTLNIKPEDIWQSGLCYSTDERSES